MLTTDRPDIRRRADAVAARPRTNGTSTTTLSQRAANPIDLANAASAMFAMDAMLSHRPGQLKMPRPDVPKPSRWVVLLRFVSDKIAPTLGPFRPPTGLPAVGQLPDLGQLRLAM
jgi:hypothetical protein